MKKVILFSALAILSVSLAGCSGGDSTSLPISTMQGDSENSFVSGTSTEYLKGSQSNGDWQYRFDEEINGIVIEKCLCLPVRNGSTIREEEKDKDIVVPDSFEGMDGLKVLEIGDNAFSHMDCRSLTLPDGLLYIGKKAFYCTYVTEPIRVPETIKSSGMDAFHGLKTETIILPQWETIPEAMFYGVEVEYLTIPECVKEIEKNAFNLGTIKELNLNEGLIRVDSGAFSGVALDELVLPSTIEDISGFDLFMYPSVTYKGEEYKCTDYQQRNALLALFDGTNS